MKCLLKLFLLVSLIFPVGAFSHDDYLEVFQTDYLTDEEDSNTEYLMDLDYSANDGGAFIKTTAWGIAGVCLGILTLVIQMCEMTTRDLDAAVRATIKEEMQKYRNQCIPVGEPHRSYGVEFSRQKFNAANQCLMNAY